MISMALCSAEQDRAQPCFANITIRPQAQPLRTSRLDHGLVTYRHGLRASEVCDLQWHQVELDQGRMHVRRAKNGTPSVHPIRGDENSCLTQAPP